MSDLREAMTMKLYQR